MLEAVLSIIIGIVFIFIGISNMKGNISTLHSYHRKRVKEEDKLPLGKRVGIGIIIVGITIIISGIMLILMIYTNNEIFETIGSIITAIGIIVGITISLLAINKYNNGLF